MTTNPYVSIIIPCYNYGSFLSGAIDSIITQTFNDWECIIVNDGSSDNTEQIALKYQYSDVRIRYIFQENAGHSAARNTGLKNSYGKYIQFLDADDQIQKDKLKLQVALMEQKPDVDLVYSDILAFRHNDPNKKFSPANFAMQTPISGKGEALIIHLVNTNFFLPGCVMMRREIYDQIGNMKKIYGFEDWEYFSRMALAGFYFYHDDRDGVKLLSGTHGNNTSHKGMEMIKSKIIVREEIIKNIKKLPKNTTLNFSDNFIKNVLKEHQKYLVYDKAILYLYTRKYFVGLKYMLLNAVHSKNPLHSVINNLKWVYYGLKKAFG